MSVGSILEIVDRRSVLVGAAGEPGDPESRQLVDTATGRRTAFVAFGSVDEPGAAVAGHPGLLSAAYGVGDPGVVLARPGGARRRLYDGEASTALALGATTAYFRVPDAVGPPRGTVVPSRAVGLTVAPAPGKAAAPRASPAGSRGRCEGAGTTTLLRVPGARVARRAAGATVVCATRSGKRLVLEELVPGVATDPDDASLSILAGTRLAQLRGRLADGRPVAAVVDLRAARTVHVATGAVGTAFAIDAAGIAAADPVGGLRWITGRDAATPVAAGQTLASDPEGPDPAIAPGAAFGDGVVVHWRTADGTARSWAPPGR